MEFSIPGEVQTLVRKVRDFLATEVMPVEPIIAKRGFRAMLPELGRLRQRVKELGMFAPHLPRDLGGLGLSLTDFAHVSEALGRSFLGHYVFNCQAPDAGNMELLLLHGSPEQKTRWLEPLARGEIRSCFAMTEPDRPGSNPTWLATSARRDGDDYVIDGHKWFTSGADGAAFTIVMAVTNPDAPPHLRASQIIVPIPHPGFELVRNIPVMGHPGEDYESHGEVRFTACRVPESHRIGDEGAGFVLAQERLAAGRIHHCMRWIGICERAFELMCERAVTPHDRAGQAARHAADDPGLDRRIARRDQRRSTDGLASGMEDRSRGRLRRARRDLASSSSTLPAFCSASWIAPSRCTARSASPTTRRLPIGTASNAARASTTARTRCTSPWSPSASSGNTAFR